MSDEQLSEDMADWPTDEFALLGVTIESDRKSAKRSYVRLIRRFKPDEFPKQFQRIREAYEYVDRQIEVQSLYGSVSDDASDESTGEFTGNKIPEVQSEMPKRQAPRADETSERDSAWQLAIDGRHDEAYSKLKAIIDRGTASSKTYCQLYWLVKLVPSVDESHTCVQWLREGLRANRAAGDLLDLYHREMNVGSQADNGDDVVELFKLTDDIGHSVSLTLQRWHAMFRNGTLDLIGEDVKRLRPLVSRRDETYWASMLVSAMDYLAWMDSTNHEPFLCREYQQEIDRMPHVHLPLQDSLDRLDFLLVASQYWRTLRTSPPHVQVWIDAVPKCWVEPASEAIHRLMPIIHPAGTTPFRALASLDYIAAEATPLASVVAQQLQTARYYLTDSVEREDEEAIDDIRRFAQMYNGYAYHQVRGKILELCINECIEPSQVAATVAEMNAVLERSSGWEDSLENDLSLRAVHAGYRVFWAS